MKRIVNKLIQQKKTISTMESCTGGYIVNEITNINNSSEVIKYSAVTYSNESKIKMGVSEELITKYGVYSQEVAMNMAKSITDYTKSDYGIGITGTINRIDKNNKSSRTDLVYISIYNKDINSYKNKIIKCLNKSRTSNKKYILKEIKKELEIILWKIILIE